MWIYIYLAADEEPTILVGVVLGDLGQSKDLSITAHFVEKEKDNQKEMIKKGD